MKRYRPFGPLYPIFIGLSLLACPSIVLAADTLIIADEAGGRDCTSIGLWDESTKTCTLTGDFEGFVAINADGITLDGAGFTLGALGGPAVAIHGRSHVTVRNVKTQSASQGMLATNGSFITIRDNNLHSQGGVGFHNISDGSIENNTFVAPAGGGIAAISVNGDLQPNSEVNARNVILDNSIQGQFSSGMTLSRSYESEVSRNSFSGIRQIAVSLTENDLLIARDNSVAESGFGYFVTPYSSGDFSRDSIFKDNTQDNLEFKALYDATSTPNFGTTTLAGLLCVRCHDMSIEGFTFLGSGLGLSLGHASNVVVKNNTFGLLGTAIASKSSQNIVVTHNDFQQYNAVLATHNGAGDIRFSEPLPQGGNHYSPVDEPGEGCTDPDGDFVCEEDIKHATGYWDEAPWVDTEHWQSGEEPAVCCSNVAFLPGHGASRLYRPGTLGEDKLWEPNGINDLSQLGQDPTSGESTLSDIYTRDVVDETTFQFVEDWPFTNTYKDFFAFMDGEAGEGKLINEWKPLPYDWRFTMDEVLEKGTVIQSGGDTVSYIEASDAPYILSELRRLADSSKTGKVTLITHSNGGLLAKYLLYQLEHDSLHAPYNQYQDLLTKIDKVILVATPQLGTPKATRALLHGSTRLFESAARDFAENMPSAYHLLPSPEYFNVVQSPVFQFTDEISNVPELADLANTSITDYNGAREFMTGRNGKWSAPGQLDTVDMPNVLKSWFLNYAEGLHSKIDGWKPPDLDHNGAPDIKVIQIAGVGLATDRGIEYDNCDIPFCADTLQHLDRTLLKTDLGDGTVVLPSAVAMGTSSVDTYYVDFRRINRLLNRNRNHSSIMEIASIQQFLKNLLKSANDLTENVHDNLSPILRSGDTLLYFTLHSPVAIHLYDESNAHTGLTEIHNGLRAYEAEIPNSFYEEFGEIKYAGVDGGKNVNLVLEGEDLGKFTLEIEETEENEIVAAKVFSDIPVTASTTAKLQVSEINNITGLIMDVNGDGVSDVTVGEGEGVSEEELLTILVGIIKTLNLSKDKEKKIIKALNKLEKALEKDDKCSSKPNSKKCERKVKQKLSKAFERILGGIIKMQQQGIITSDEAFELKTIIERIRIEIN